MRFAEKWKTFWSPNLALAFDRDTLWSVASPSDEPRRTASCVALDEKTRKVAAVGDEALALRGDMRTRCVFTHYVRAGSVNQFDEAEVAFRHAIRALRKGRSPIAPRVLVAASGGDVHKRAIKDALTYAGAREVITIPRVMAAAIGAGLDVQETVNTVVYVDRDWWSAAVIGRNAMLASCESFDAPEHLAVERVWRKRAEGDETTRNFDGEFAVLWRDGVEHDEACERWVRRMGEHQRVMATTLSKADVQAARRGGIYLVGPCAKLPGLRAMMETCWGRAVTVPPRPEEAVILGCRTVLGELDAVLKSFK